MRLYDHVFPPLQCPGRSYPYYFHSVLAQATYTFIASQLLVKEEKAKIDEVFRVMDVS